MADDRWREFSDTFREVPLSEALGWASELPPMLRMVERDRLLVAVFAGGLEIAWRSECAGPYSEVTPDLNWDAPTVWARCVRE